VRRALLTAGALALMVSGCGGKKDGAAPAAPVTKAALDEHGCIEHPAGKLGKQEPPLTKPTARLDASGTYVATVVTTCGTFKITLDPKDSPRTTASFQYLASKHFYDGLVFHRIITDFVIQGGDPKGTGVGGPGYTIVEPPPKSTRYTDGVVAMAKTDTEAPGTSGSQFFIASGSQAATLPPDYAVLGRVTSGMDVIERMNAIRTDPRTDFPDNPIVINSIRVTGGD
jgi:cyclophilin family peptidyl-prolyl cis-trans isomerase